MVSRSKNYENFEQTTSSTSSDDEDSKGSEDNERLVNKVNVYCDSDDDSDSSVNDSLITSEHEGEKLAAAALCVGVGSFSDPRHVQGLAHFLEHMIFMGSKKYPRENEYDSFISVSFAKVINFSVLLNIC